MEIRHLKAFQATMQHGSTVGAAQALGVSQPSISRLLSEMETIRGETLFMRTNGRLMPRPNAELLLPEVERTLAGITALGTADAGQGTPLSIAAPGGIITALVAPACKRLMQDFPDMRLSAEIMSYYDALNAVAVGRTDMAVVKTPVDHPAVTAIELVTVGCEVVMPIDHPLAARDVILPADLAGRPLVLLGRNRPFRMRLEQVLEAVGVTPRVTIETHAVSAACAFVAQGMGLTVANALLTRAELNDVITARPFDAEIAHGFCLIHARDPNRPRLVAAMAEHLRDVVRLLMDTGGRGDRMDQTV